MIEKIDDLETIHAILRDTRTGLWRMELEEGKKPRLYGDRSAFLLLGLSTPKESSESPSSPAFPESPEAFYEWWSSGIRETDRQALFTCLEGIPRRELGRISRRESGRGAEDKALAVEFDWEQSGQERRQIRCTVFRDCDFEGGILLKGWFQDVTGIETTSIGTTSTETTSTEAGATSTEDTEGEAIKEKNQTQVSREDLFAKLNQNYYSVYCLDLVDGTEEAVWQDADLGDRGEFKKGPIAEGYEKFVRLYVYAGDQERVKSIIRPEFLRSMLTPERPVYDVDFRRVYSGHISWVRSRFGILEMADGVITKVVLANMDIQDQKMKELEEERQRKLYFDSRNVIKGLSAFYHSIFSIDLDNRTFYDYTEQRGLKQYVGGSNSYDLLLQCYRDKYIIKEDQERFYKELSVESIRERVKNGEMRYEAEYQRDYGGHYGWMRVHTIVSESKGDIPSQVILAAHNVEAEKKRQKRSEEALVAAYEAAEEANHAKSYFLTQISHDIRTPLNAIIGMSAIANSHTGHPEQVADCLKKIDASSRYLLGLINEILDISRMEQGELKIAEEPFSILGLIHDIQEIMEPMTTEKLQIFSVQKKGLVHDDFLGDSNAILQILLNILSNASKYTPAGGHISLDLNEVNAQTKEGCCLVMTVEDDGIGMSRDFLSRLFQPFLREEDVYVKAIQGTGLGMSITQGLVSAMQGDIQVESEKGKGSKFTVTLFIKPVQMDETACATVGEEVLMPKTVDGWPKGVHLLLAEDNELNKEIAQTILEDWGVLVDTAANGLEVTAAFESSDPGTYHAILMDIQMPFMDGYAAARKIRSSDHPQAQTIPIIAVTANAFADDMAKALSIGMNEHICKPIDFERLLEVLKKVLN